MSSDSRRHEERALLRRRIVRACYVVGALGLTVDLLREYTRTPAGRPEAEAAREAVDYLVGAGLLEEVSQLISPVNAAWKITKEGRDYAEKEGLDE